MSADIAAQTTENSQADPSPEQRRRAAWRSWCLSYLVLPLVLLIILASVAVIAPAVHFHKLDTSATENQPYSANERLQQVKAIIFENETAPESASSEAELTRINVALDAVAFTLETAHVKQAISRCEAASTDWESLYRSTLNDAVGNRLANSSRLVADLVALQSMAPPDSNSTNLDSESEKVLAARTAAPGTSETLLSVSRIKATALEWYEYHQMRLQILRELRSEAERFSPSNTSLSEILRSRDAEINTQRMLLVERSVEETEASMRTTLGELENSRDAHIQTMADLQRQLEQVKNGQGLSSSKNENVLLTPASRIDYEKELPALRDILKPFISPGYTQPESASEMVYGRSKIPMSYSALRKVGALSETEEGLAILFRIGGSRTDKLSNDRPLGKFPKIDLSSELKDSAVEARVKEAQRLLIAYGLLMIEDRLLSP